MRLSAHAARPREDDVVLVQLLDHRGARDLHHDRHHRERERHRRQRQMPETIDEAAARSEGREPAEHDAEDVEQEDPGDEGRRGNAEHAEHHHRAVEPRAALEAPRRTPSRMPTTSTITVLIRLRTRRHAGALADGAQHPAVAVDRAAEIALQHLPEPFAVLDDEGIVQVVALAERRERLRVGRPRAEQRPHRIAGREMNQREDAEGDDEKQRHGDGQPPEDEADEIGAAHRSGPR